MSAFEKLVHFKPDEKVDGRLSFPRPEKMNSAFLKKLDEARTKAGVPFIITSSFREDSKTSHGRGTGVDMRCAQSTQRFRILKALLEVGFSRIGVYDKHIHVDLDDQSPQGVVWWGTSE
jgi:zinc D-Ala-D-Ala carboxypeptidase